MDSRSSHTLCCGLVYRKYVLIPLIYHGMDKFVSMSLSDFTAQKGNLIWTGENCSRWSFTDIYHK